MEDILSGGRIDPSTSGPTPSSKDDRSRDILLEQREKQEQDAIGGTQFPPRPQPLPPIPEPTEVAPPLPVVPSFDFNISGSAFEETREIARQTTIDILKNVTINGQGPSIEGSNIAFNVPDRPSASEAFFFQGVVVQQPIPIDQTRQTQPTQIEVVPQIAVGAANTIERPNIEVAVAQPMRGIEPPNLPEVRVPQIEPPQEPEKIITPEEVRVERPPILEVQDENGPIAPAYDRLSSYPVFEKDGQPMATKAEPLETDGGPEKSIGPRYTQLSDYPTLGSGRPTAQKNDGPDITFEDAQSLRDKARGTRTTAGEPRSEEDGTRRDRGPSFDRESSVRQAGETPSEFRERQEQLRQERTERVEREKIIQRAREGDIQEVPSGLIPVSFTRADGQKKIFTLLASEFVGVVEGGDNGERTTILPEDGSYYEAGGAVLPAHPWKVSLRTLQNGTVQWKVELNSELYSGLENFSEISVGNLNTWYSASTGYVVLEGEVDDGTCTDASVQGIRTNRNPRMAFSQNDQTSFAYPIAYLYLDENDTFRVLQLAFQNLTLMNCCVNGIPAIYPFPT